MWIQKRTSPLIRTIVLLISLLSATVGTTQADQSLEGISRDQARFSIAVSGDMIGPRHPVMSGFDKEVQNVAKIFQAADVGVTNLEGSVFNPRSFDAVKAPENGGGYPLYDVTVASDYKRFGIDMVSRANNHAVDFGIDGMLETSRVLDTAGIAHAGAGSNGLSARSATYYQTGNGRVALVSAASTFPPMAASGDIGTDTQGRPGINALRIQQILLVTEAEMRTLHEIAGRQDWEGTPVHDPHQQYFGGQQQIGGIVFRVSSTPGQTWEVNERDRKTIVDSIAEARQNADYVVFSIHAHERHQNGRPADFLRPLFHDVIDAGADLVVRHGPHYLNGIEIYNGKPILYDMGSLFSPLGRRDRFVGESPSGTPASRLIFDIPPAWNDGAVAVSEFHNGRLEEVRIHPIIIDTGSGPTLGNPRLADPRSARRILEKLQKDSEIYGTHVSVEGAVGIVRVPGSTP